MVGNRTEVAALRELVGEDAAAAVLWRPTVGKPVAFQMGTGVVHLAAKHIGDVRVPLPRRHERFADFALAAPVGG